jgi:hypothetical protein
MFLWTVSVHEDLHQVSTTEGGLETMLGEQLGEASGKVTGTRLLRSEGPIPKQEVSFQGSGKMLTVDMNDFGTYFQVVSRPGGVLYGEGQVVIVTPDGDMALWTGFGVGRSTGRFPAGTFGVCGSFQTESQKLAHLNTVATVVEYQVDENGNYTWKLWEWK